MTVSRPFKVPSMIPQDLAIIMELVDPPEPVPTLHEKGLPVRRHKRKGSPNIVSRSAIDADNDISSSCTESEDEVEAQIAVSSRTDGTANAKTTLSPVITFSSSDEEDSDSQSSSSELSSSRTSFRPRNNQILPSATDIDINDDGLSAPATYVPTTHELPPAAIPVPSLPDPSTLPLDTLELVGDIVTVLKDIVTIRGGSLLGSSARERRDAVLDEGSLLLLDDRTPLGYVSETFGPTTLPHYLVRIKRWESTLNTISASQSSTDDCPEPVQGQPVSIAENNPQFTYPSSPPSTSSPHDYIDPAKIFVSRAVYHIPSVSQYVFPSALAGIKGSDASNIHDEEPAEHELDFSDDEAETMHRRLRKGSFSRASSQTPFSRTFDGEGSRTISTVDGEAGSLYGASPYDFEDMSSPNPEMHGVPPSPSVSDSPASSTSFTKFQDAAVQNALMLARNSRHRRHSSVSISEVSSVAGPSRPRDQDHQTRGRGKRGDRIRGKDRGRSERGREQNFRGQARSRGHRSGVAPGRRDGGHLSNGARGSSFSFEEYDPHMPRPPSPTSLAIARAIGQWADGTPFPYSSGAIGAGCTAIGPETHATPPTNDFQGDVPMYYSPAPYGVQEYYDPAVTFSQTSQYQSLHVGNYGITPHINPRFAQIFRSPNSTQASLVNPQNLACPPGSLDTPIAPSHAEPSEAGPGSRSDD